MSNRRRARRTGNRQRSWAGRDSYTAGANQTIINVEAGKRERMAGPAKPPMGQVVFGEIPKRPPAFRERESLRDAISNAGRLAVISTLAGARGIGKSQLAAAYARDCIGTGWRLVAWISAERPDQVLAGLGQLARLMKLRDKGDDSEAAAAKVRQWLEMLRDERALVVFDNATDPDSLIRWLPSAGSAQVLITSNRRSFDSLGTLIDVDVFTSAEALAYLGERTGLQDTAGASALSAELGRLPLALAQASGVIRAQRLSYAEFLDRLKKVSLDKYLRRQPGDDYPRGAAETVILALEQAERGDRVARSLLLALSVFSPDGVSRDLLYAVGSRGFFDSLPALGSGRVKVSPEKIDAALEKLAETSLVTYSIDGQAVIMHRFTQRVCRERENTEVFLDVILLRAARMIARQCQAVEPAWRHPDEADDLINQISSIWDNAQIRFAPDSPSVPVLRQWMRSRFEKLLISLRVWSVHQLIEAGSWRRAVQLGTSVAADGSRVLGPDHPLALSACYELAVAYRNIGRLDEAIDLLRQTLAGEERVLGADHPNTLVSRRELDITLRERALRNRRPGGRRPTLPAWERDRGLTGVP